MAVQLQPAEIELRIITDEAERQLAAFREQAKMEGEVGDFQAGEGPGTPARLAERLQQVKEEQDEKSWGQRDAFFQTFAKGSPPRVWTELKNFAVEKTWQGVDAIHGRRVVESAGNFISGISKAMSEGRITGVVDSLIMWAGPMLRESDMPGMGGKNEAIARTIGGAVRIGAEVARLGALYGPKGGAVKRKALDDRIKAMGEEKDEQGNAIYDASFLEQVARDALGGFSFDRGDIINAEAGMKASVATLSQMTTMGTAMMRTNVGAQLDGMDTVNFMTEYAGRLYDYNKAHEKMRMEADIEGTRMFIEKAKNVLLDRMGLAGTELE